VSRSIRRKLLMRQMSRRGTSESMPPFYQLLPRRVKSDRLLGTSSRCEPTAIQFSVVMMHRRLAGLLALGVLLTGAIVSELASGGADGGDTMASSARLFSTPPHQAATSPAQGESRQALADDLLGRPLFAALRRPPVAPVPPRAPPPPSPPRLAGILVSGPSRSAIFAAVGEGRSVVAQEGMEVGGYTVQLIEAGQVTLSGPGGQQMLQPTFDAQPQGAADGGATAGSAAWDALPFAPATEIMLSLRDLPGFSGIAAQ